MKIFKSIISKTLLVLLFSSNLFADCSFELFSISSTKGTKILDFIEQLSDECEFTVIVDDPHAEKFLDSTLNKTHIKNLTIDEVLNIILTENNLSYTLKNNILKISYLTTKVYNIDYILSQRKSVGKTDITLSSSSAGSSADSAEETTSSSGANTESGIKIESNDEVKFWQELDLELQSILNRPHDSYIADAPIINKNAGLITVTCTVKQMARLDKYLEKLQSKVQLQVLIDVQILAVTMSEGHSTGVDWSQLYALQNFTLSTHNIKAKNVDTFTDTDITTGLYPSPTTGDAVGSLGLLQLKATATLKEVIKFLQTQGDVSAISNPKVLTLNNQPALITVGTEYFYKITSSTTTSTTSTTSSEDEVVQSVFAGVLLDITPEISDDRTITLKINPSISETREDIGSTTSADRTMPPDLDRRQLSSVVTVKDGNRIILGGLINTKTTDNSNQVPYLGSIPVLGYLFKYEEQAKSTQELIIIIEPHIIDKEKSKLSLKDLGYKGMNDQLLKSGTPMSEKLIKIDVK
ncbi:pilus (MSHA type) biogenesis protein MshL [Sulfurimonas sp.]